MIYYEVGLYNKSVRKALANGDYIHPDIEKWEEVHYFNVKAESEKQAIKKIRLEYPEIKGFVIECVTEYGE